MRKIFTLLFLLASFVSFSQSTTVVISQIYGNGGNTGATYNADYVELHNVSSSTISLNGYSIQYGSTAVTGAWSGVYALPATASIAPGGYFLIQMTAAGSVGIAIPTADATAFPTINMSGANGRVAIVNGTTALTACPAATAYVDYVGFGTTTCFEGTGAAPTQTATTADFRKNNGCTETNDNANDFEVLPASPRNSATTPFLCGVATPTLTASALTAFGNVCINTTSTANSFTLTGSNLTAANITVGALAGYTYSTTVGGTYTATLNLVQSGGSYSQQIFVKLTPTAVQSYSGNIPVAGGGVASFNVAASGAGVNTVPSLTAGTATGITSSGATVPGTITSNGCSAVTAYGIEWSPTAGFANGSGTQVPSSNVAGNNFSSAIVGLAAGTVYYYHAYATNAGGTGYSTQGTFTTSSGPATLSAGALTAFGAVCLNTTTAANSFTITGSNLTTANVTVGALAGYTYSTTVGGTYTTTLTLTQTGGNYSQQIFVKFTPTAVQSYNGNIAVGGGGATAINVAASGSGINTQATVVTGGSSSVTSTSAVAAGTISANGCSTVTAYGIEYSTTSGFTPGTGTQSASTNIAGGNYTSSLSPLAAGTTYYYYAYATNAGGTAYGTIMSFTTPAAATPALSPSALAAFGNVCINTTAGPNSFTISGSNLTNANVTVGALAGYTYSTTSGGTYTTTLSLTQAGGTYSQQIFVKFTPTAVQSYNGNIPVGGGGATTANVAASGAGINTAATVTSGAASAITSTSATVAGTIPSTGCSPLTAYGIEFSTTNGFANGAGTTVASTNLAGVNFSSALAGLAPSTVYYFHAYATTSAGTVYGTQGTFTTLTPSITAGTLTAFGAVCLNTTVGPNSFTITGTNLTTANVNVAALAGYTYSTTSGGTYTTTLSLTQTGGAYSQQIFVKFTPTAVQSYNGNIAVTGGGATGTVNVAASGSGINTAPTVTTAATPGASITQTSASPAGTIPTTGCSAITTYGIEYSTTNGFANGTGTAVASTNLSGVNFSSSLTGLALNTTYYYHAYATNAGGTVYGAQQSFTTLPAILTATSLTAFGSICINTTAGPNSFTINSTLVSAANINVAALAGYTYSTTATGTYTTTLSLTHAAGAYSQQIFVKFTPTLVASYNGNIVVSGGGATASINVAASGAGVNTGATVVTNDATNITRNSATLNGSVLNGGCNTATEYGIEYSSISGFTTGTGIKVVLPVTNVTGDSSITLSNLVPATTYYYRAYAVSAVGKTYGAEKAFTTLGIANLGQFVIYSNPIQKGGVLRYSIGGILPAHYIISLVNMQGQVVYTQGVEVPTPITFIDGKINVPGKLPAGVYTMQLRNINTNDTYHKSFILE